MQINARRLGVWIFIPVAIVVIAGLSIAGYYLLQERPTITLFTPMDGTVGVPGQTPIRIEFSREMDQAVTEKAVVITPAVDGEFTWQENTLTFTPSTPWPKRTTITVDVNTQARAARGRSMESALTWQFKSAGVLLTYLWPSIGPSGLYALDPDTGDSLLLVEPQYGVLDYSASPDGLTIYFTTPIKGGAAVRALDRVTGEITSLGYCANGACERPVLSPDGEYLAYENSTSAEVWLLHMGDEEAVLQTGTTQPAWSPSGWLSVYNGYQREYVFSRVDGSSVLTLPSLTGEPGVWHPDEDIFLYTEIITGNLSHLIAFDVNKKRSTVLAPEEETEDATPVYSPNGTQIAFGRLYLDPLKWTRGRQLWIMNSNGTNPVPLTNDIDYHHLGFAWHPQGRMLAYQRFNQALISEPPEIWIYDLTTGTRLRMVIDAVHTGWLP